MLDQPFADHLGQPYHMAAALVIVDRGAEAAQQHVEIIGEFLMLGPVLVQPRIADALHIGFFGGEVGLDIGQQLFEDVDGRRDVVLLQAALDQIEKGDEFPVLGIQLGIADLHRIAPNDTHTLRPPSPQLRQQRRP